MPQGISSAPKEYQRCQNEALAGLNGVEVIADDILCYGSGETMEDAVKDHDSNLLNLLDRARSRNLKLNKKNLRLRLDQVTYMGYYSDYFELDFLSDTTAESVIDATKRHFARHGIADMVTDDGPQYSSAHLSKFAREWEFQHTTSSPLHSQSNGKAESAVKIAKNLVKKAKRGNKDLQMSLLEWCNTPDSSGLSPVQKLMSRRSRSTIPTTEVLLKPEVIDGVYENIKRKRQQAKAAYDKHAKPLPELHVGEPVRLQPINPKAPWAKGSCVAKIGPRSYLIETEGGNLYRRNRKFIRQDPSQELAPSDSSGTNLPSHAESPTESLPGAKADSPSKQAPTMRQTHKRHQSNAVEETVTSQPQQAVVTRSGRTSGRPSRFDDFVI